MRPLPTVGRETMAPLLSAMSFRRPLTRNTCETVVRKASEQNPYRCLSDAEDLYSYHATCVAEVQSLEKGRGTTYHSL